MKRKSIMLVAILMLAGAVISAITFQTMKNPEYSNWQGYDAEWKVVDSLENQGLPESALKAVETIYTFAKTDKNDEQLKLVTDIALKIKKALTARGIAVVYDDDEQAKPGWKFAEYEMKGVPVRLAIGPRDVESGTVELARRDTKEKMTVQITDIELKIENLLEQIQQNIFKKAVDFRETSTHVADSMDEFIKILDTKGGFVFAHWDGTAETEEKIKEQTKATIRCIPLNNKQENGKCILTGKPSTQRVLFARAY